MIGKITSAETERADCVSIKLKACSEKLFIQYHSYVSDKINFTS